MFVDDSDVCRNKINESESLREMPRLLVMQKFGRQLKLINLSLKLNVPVSDPSTLHRKIQTFIENIIREIISSYIAHTVQFPNGNHTKTYCR